MIEEHDLRALLAEAAESVPPPGRAPEALFDTLAEQTAAQPPRRPPWQRLTAMAAAVLAMVMIGTSLARDGSSSFRSTGTAPEPSTTVASAGDDAGTPSAGGDADAGDGEEQKRDLVESAEDTAGGAGSEAASTPAGEAEGSAEVPSPEQPVDGAKVVKTGSLDLEVRTGAFEGTVARITAQAIGLGGYIAESTTSESGESPSGAVVVRVPEESFETLLADLRELGEVKAVSSKGTDVTAQFTDLAARLTALTATRDRLSAVLSEAGNVADILAVQDRITVVQVEIEQLQGQQRLLEDQTSFATLAITLGEPGAEIITAANADDGLGHAWEEARRRFGDSLEGVVSWSGSAAVVALGLLLLAGLGRLAWIGLRRRMV